MKPINSILIMVLSWAYNLGDELILRAEIDALRKRYPDARIAVATYDPHSFLGSRENIQFFSYFPNALKKYPFKNIGYWFRQIFEIARSDAVIIGGGGIFFDNEVGISFQKNLWEWKIRLFFARLFRKRIAFLGISLEVKCPENQQKLRGIFRETDAIFPRDARSVDMLASLGVKAKLGADSAFLLPPQGGHMRHKKRIGVSLRGGFLSENDIAEMRTFLANLASSGYEICFLSHSLMGEESHHDAKFIRSYFGDVYQITETLEATLDAYKMLDFVVAMRFHSVLLAAQHGIPMLVLPYGPKVVSLSQDLNITEHTIDTKRITSTHLGDLFLFLCNNYERLQAEIIASYTKMHKNCLQKWKNPDIIGL